MITRQLTLISLKRCVEVFCDWSVSEDVRIVLVCAIAIQWIFEGMFG
jgi:hypothetical protein